jgi:hypothetical protein
MNLTHSQLHAKAIEILALIADNNAAIKATKDNLVLLEKDPVLYGQMKDVFISQQHDTLNAFRDIKAMNVQTYAEIMQQLTEPIMSVSSNGLNFNL